MPIPPFLYDQWVVGLGLAALGGVGTKIYDRVVKQPHEHTLRMERIRKVNPEQTRDPLEALREYEDIRKDFAASKDPLATSELEYFMAAEKAKVATESRAESDWKDALRYANLALERGREALGDERFARLQGIVGTANNGLSEIRSPATHLHDAAGAFAKAIEASEGRDRTRYRINLGNVYNRWSDVADLNSNCDRAIAAYQEALRAILPEDKSLWASVQGNLAAVYLTRAYAKGPLPSAAESRDISNQLINDSAVKDVAWIFLNLGSAHVQLCEAEDVAANANAAIQACEKASLLAHAASADQSLANHTKGAALSRLGRIDEALACFAAAHQVRTPNSRPNEYAETCIEYAAALHAKALQAGNTDCLRQAELLIATGALAANREGGIIAGAELWRVRGEHHLTRARLQWDAAQLHEALRSLAEARAICEKETLEHPMRRIDKAINDARALLAAPPVTSGGSL